MQGVIEDYFPARESGLIRALDGNFYIFTRWEWGIPKKDPETGMAVDFEPGHTPIRFHALKVHPVSPAAMKVCETRRVCAESF